MKSMQASNSATSFTPELTSLADLGSMAAADSGAESGLPSSRRNSGGWASYWDPFLEDIGKTKKEEEVVKPVDPDPIDPEDEKTDGRKFTEKLYGGQSLTDDELTAKMKFNPATTPEDWARAFGKCRTTTSSDKHASIPSDCYWPEESGLEGSDFYSVGKGGGTAHAKRGQAASRAKAAGGRAVRKGGKGNDGGVRSDIQLKENITYIDKSPEGHSIYEWNYKGEPKSRRYQGVMAQELLETAPHAVVTMDDGYLGVKYDEIDVDCTITS